MNGTREYPGHAEGERQENRHLSGGVRAVDGASDSFCLCSLSCSERAWQSPMAVTHGSHPAAPAGTYEDKHRREEMVFRGSWVEQGP